jgi:predicted ferric reductase
MRTVGGWTLGIAFAAGAAVAVGLWLGSGGPSDVHDGATALAAAGRICGLLGAYLALVQLVLLARLPPVERLIGLDRVIAWHRVNGQVCLLLLVGHAVLITTGYAVGDGVGLPSEISRLISGYPGVITATAALVLLIAVTVSSIGIARRRLRYETWYFVHLYAYVAVALAFSHQLATGTDFVGRPGARAYWTALYVATGAALVIGRLVLPALNAARHRLRVVRVVEEGPGVTSIEIGGRHLARLRAQSGQFFTWRFLTRDRWWESHPFSLSAAPDGRRLRITVKGVGDYTARLRAIPPGTRVIAEGPFGTFTAAARRNPRVALIAGGVGITPIRALLESMPGGPEDITVIYRVLSAEDLILREELDELAARRGVGVHYLIGSHEPDDLLSPEHLRTLMPDIASRDVYVCGPPAMVDATQATLGRTGVARRHIRTERFAY